MVYLYIYEASGLTIHEGQKPHEQRSYVGGMEHGTELSDKLDIEYHVGSEWYNLKEHRKDLSNYNQEHEIKE